MAAFRPLDYFELIFGIGQARKNKSDPILALETQVVDGLTPLISTAYGTLLTDYALGNPLQIDALVNALLKYLAAKEAPDLATAVSNDISAQLKAKIAKALKLDANGKVIYAFDFNFRPVAVRQADRDAIAKVEKRAKTYSGTMNVEQQTVFLSLGSQWVPIPPFERKTTGFNSAVIFSGALPHSYGGITPSSIIAAKTIRSFEDVVIKDTTVPTPMISASLAINSATDPGSAWLESVTAGGVTKTGASATYSYGYGIATWHWWSESFGFVNGVSTPVTIVRK